MNRNELESGIERAHLLIVRGELRPALALLTELQAKYPTDPDVARLIAEAETKLASGRRAKSEHSARTSRIRRRVMRFVGIGCLIVAYVLLRTSGGSRYGPLVTAGPVVLGLRLIYWRLIGIAALAICGSVILLVSSFLDPDWSDFDNPSSRGCSGWFYPF